MLVHEENNTDKFVISNGTIVYTYFKCGFYVIHSLSNAYSPQLNRYMEDAINSLKAKGAQIVVASQTPDNPFVDTSGVPIYVGYAQQVAEQTNVSYVDHFDFILRQYKALFSLSTEPLFSG